LDIPRDFSFVVIVMNFRRRFILIKILHDRKHGARRALVCKANPGVSLLAYSVENNIQESFFFLSKRAYAEVDIFRS
jgi:hypothetical protein